MAKIKCKRCNRYIDAMGMPSHLAMHERNAQSAVAYKKPIETNDVVLEVRIDGETKVLKNEEITDLLCKYFKDNYGWRDNVSQKSVEVTLKFMPRQ